jgi:WD40 repeat protein
MMRHPIPVLLLITVTAHATHAGHAAAADPDNDPTPTPKLLGKLPGSSGTSLSFSPDGQRILTANTREARIWDATTLRPLTPTLPHADRIERALFSPNGRSVLTFGGKRVNLWDPNTGQPTIAIEYQHDVLSASFSPDGRRIVVGENNARVYDTLSGQQILTIPLGAEVGFVAYSSAGDKILTLSDNTPNGVAYVWDGTTGRRICGPLEDANYCPFPLPAAFSPDGKNVVTVDFKMVKVWDTGTGNNRHILFFEDGDWPASALAFSPDGTKLAAGKPGGVRFFDTATWKEVRPEIHAAADLEAYIAFTPDGKRLLESSEAAVWELATGKSVLKMRQDLTEPHNAFEQPVVALSPDGKRVAAGWPKGNYTRIWEIP